MRKMRKGAVVMAGVMALSGLSGLAVQAEAAVNEELSGKVVVWDWDVNRIGAQVEEFNKVYPNIEVEIVPLASSGEYRTKVISAVAAGTDLPDIGCIEMNDRHQLLNLGIWDNLENEPYNFDPASVVEYTNVLNTTDGGEVVGVESTLCPTGLAYKKDLAEKYLGTSDPAELEAMLPDWDTVLEVGKKIKEENPDIYLFASADEDLWTFFTGQGNQCYATEDGQLNEEALKTPVHRIYEFVTAGVCDRMQGYSTSWYDQFSNDDNYIFDICANWSPQFNIEPSDPDNENQWGFMKAPGGALSSGGTSLTVYNQSEVKEEAWALISWMLLQKEGAEIYKNNIGYYAPLASLYEDEEFVNWTTSCFGDQNVGEKMYKEIVPEMNVRQLSQYDTPVGIGKTSWMTLMYTGIDDMTEEECFESLIAEINANLN